MGGESSRGHDWGACPPATACLAGRERVESAQAVIGAELARKPAHAVQACTSGMGMCMGAPPTSARGSIFAIAEPSDWRYR